MIDWMRDHVKDRQGLPSLGHQRLLAARQLSFALLVHVPFIHYYHPVVERIRYQAKAVNQDAWFDHVKYDCPKFKAAVEEFQRTNPPRKLRKK